MEHVLVAHFITTFINTMIKHSSQSVTNMRQMDEINLILRLQWDAQSEIVDQVIKGSSFPGIVE